MGANGVGCDLSGSSVALRHCQAGGGEQTFDPLHFSAPPMALSSALMPEGLDGVVRGFGVGTVTDGGIDRLSHPNP